MYSRQLIVDHYAESLDNFTGAAQAGLSALHKTLGLFLRMSRDHMIYPYDWSMAMAQGQATRRISDFIDEGFHASAHLATDHYAEMVRLLEAQLHVMGKTTHKALDQLQYWSPRTLESTVGSLDSLVDAAELSADQLAETSVEIARSMEKRLEG